MIGTAFDAGSPPRTDEVDGIEITSRLMNIILEMPLKEQLDLLERLDANGYTNVRKHTRTRLKKPWRVWVATEGKAPSSQRIRDIARNGMFVQTGPEDPALSDYGVGETVALYFKTPASRKNVSVIGRVVRSQEDGFGVKFLRKMAA